jgi:hypothetical protein
VTESPPANAAEVRSGLDRLKRVLRPVLALVALVFVIWAFRDLASRWEPDKVRVAWGLVALSTAPILAGGVLLALGWAYLVERMAGTKVHIAAACALHAESQLARYVPGKVGIPVVRMSGAKGIGVPAAVAGASVLVELVSFVAVGGLVGFAALSAFGAQGSSVVAFLGRLAPAVVVALTVTVLLLVVVDRARYPRRVTRVLGIEGAGPLVPRRLLLLHVAYWSTWVLHGYLVALGVGGDARGAWSVSGVFVVAPIVGFLALAAPAGVGVREAVISVGLVPVVGAAPALAALLVSRSVTLVADVIVWLALRPLRARPSAGSTGDG